MGDAAATAEALTQYAAGTVPSETGNASGSGTPTKRLYAQAYAQKIRELLAANPGLTFDLVYIDEDDIPELLVDWLDVDVNRLSLYTFADNNL